MGYGVIEPIFIVVYFIGLLIFRFLFKKFKENPTLALVPDVKSVKDMLRFTGRSIFVSWTLIVSLMFVELFEYEFCIKLFKSLSSLSLIVSIGSSVGVFGLLYVKQYSEKHLSTWITFLPTINKVALLASWGLGFISAASNFGYSVTSLLAAFGVGGATIALAAQDTVSNIFGAISILIDQPFRVGDWISIGDNVSGVVESIGFRAISIRTEKQICVSIPNNVLVKKSIENWSNLSKLNVHQVVMTTINLNKKQIKSCLEDLNKFLSDYDKITNYTMSNDYNGHVCIKLQYELKKTTLNDFIEVKSYIYDTISKILKSNLKIKGDNNVLRSL